MLQFHKKRQQDTGLVCLCPTAEGIAVAVSHPVMLDAQPSQQLKRCDFFSNKQLQAPANELKSYIQEHDLDALGCSIVLASGEYQALLTERPDVEASDMRAALWWRVKDLVSVEMENAQIDYLELPDDSVQNQSRKVYVIVADKSKINTRVTWAQELGLRVTAVEVPETAILHLLSTLCSDHVGNAVLYLNDKQSLLMLMSEGQMYLTRTLQYDYQQRTDAVVLDLQRSMDYYESQLGKAPCLKVTVLPQQSDDSAMMQALLTNIGIEVQSVNLNDIVDTQVTLSIEAQQQGLVAIAGALRREQKVRK